MAARLPSCGQSSHPARPSHSAIRRSSGARARAVSAASTSASWHGLRSPARHRSPGPPSGTDASRQPVVVQEWQYVVAKFPFGLRGIEFNAVVKVRTGFRPVHDSIPEGSKGESRADATRLTRALCVLVHVGWRLSSLATATSISVPSARQSASAVLASAMGRRK